MSNENDKAERETIAQVITLNENEVMEAIINYMLKKLGLTQLKRYLIKIKNESAKSN